MLLWKFLKLRRILGPVSPAGRLKEAGWVLAEIMVIMNKGELEPGSALGPDISMSLSVSTPWTVQTRGLIIPGLSWQPPLRTSYVAQDQAPGETTALGTHWILGLRTSRSGVHHTLAIQQLRSKRSPAYEKGENSHTRMRV